MPNISKVDRRREREARAAAKLRREAMAAGLTRRDLARMGLLAGAGLVAGSRALRAWGSWSNGGYSSGWDGGTSH
ncbi:MAG TPA: hypothetical protein VLC07_00865, partial [Solirubrobacterales bacterium]|nr:hypothetical protein [Solirubrobacterales bacterium]